MEQVALLKPNKAVVKTSLQNGILLYDPVLRTAHALNQIGALIWDMLDKDLNFEKISEKLTTSFDATASMEFSDFYSQLEQLGLLIPSDDQRTSEASYLLIPENVVYSTPKWKPIQRNY